MIENEQVTDKEPLFWSLETFVRKQYELLDLERSAEIEENRFLQECVSLKNLIKKGVCIPKLRLGSISTGLFGRSLINFQPFYSSNVFPAHVISTGDIVGIGSFSSDGKIEIIVSGVVFRVFESAITVAFDKNSETSDLKNDDQYIIVKLANDVTYRRLKKILKTLEKKGRELHLVSVLFGEKPPSSIEATLLDSISFHNINLNDTQKEAVKFALSQKEAAILHGPPGTGKTTTVVECVLQAVSQGMKVLACAPSNVAVDNLVEKLAMYKVKMVRLGHPARSLSSTQEYSLDAVISRYDGSDVVEEMHKEIDKLRCKIEKTRGSHARKSMWAENKSLLKEMKERETSIVKQVLKNVDIVLSTLTSASDDGPLKHVEKGHFDLCVIDECSQALEVACWIPLSFAKKCILAGDHNQLPPTIISEKAAQEGLSITLMERLLKLYGDSVKKMLTVQYRMHNVIMQWPSSQLYENKLQAHESVYSHLLSDLPGVESTENTTVPLLLIDTAGCDLCELEAEDEESKGNEGEADIVVLHVENLIKSGVSPSDVAIITPYNLQVDLIKARFSGKYPKLEVKSVDGFQGREKEAVVISFVRSNDKKEIGFLSEDRRINVAITRAKRHLAVVCDSDTVNHSKFLKSFVNYCGEQGEVRTAFEYESKIGHYPLGSAKQTSRKKSEKSSKSRPSQKLKSSDTISECEKGEHWQKEGDNRFSVEKTYEEIIQAFLESDKRAFSFSPSLSAFERRIVHEISEKFGLRHESTGEGADRCIEISKTLNSSSCRVSKNVENSKSMVDDRKIIESSEHCTEGSKISNSSSCSQDFKKAVVESKILENFEGETGQMNEREIQDNFKTGNETKANVTNKVKKTKVKELSKSKLKTLKVNENKDANKDEDFDALIAQAVKADNACSYDKCKKSVAVLAQVCQFCKGRFCFSHFIPEAHGCGDAVKAYFRSQIRKEGAIYSGSGKPEKKIDAQKHSLLQKKLDKKIDELSKQRKTKSKN